MKINILVKIFASILMVLGILTGALWLAADPIYADIYQTGEGEIEIAVSGSDRRISIRRNDLGIPHITAGNLNDALFGLAYAHSQDRLWQMEMNRRIGAGRLSEIFGSELVGKDKFLRTLGVYRVAEASFAHLDERAQSAYLAYRDGVNAFLSQHETLLPPEFLILGHKPEPWRITDSLVWLKMMAWDLGDNWDKELLRYQLLKTLTPSQVDEFLPAYPGDPRPKLPDLRALYADASIDGETLLAMAPEVLPDGAGSNNWVMSGQHTSSGKPLLSNDPHLGLQAPALWYYARLTTPDLDVVGATLPGVPGIILGHNQNIAWCFTNTGPDVQDLYIEKLAEAPGRYFTPGGVQAFETRQEVIRIKGEDSVDLYVRESRHGPILSDVLPSAAEALSEGHVLSMAWAALLEDDRTPAAVFGLMAAQNWGQFKNALRDFHSPQQNIVYADIEGNIGHYSPGRIPLRHADNDLMGLMPAPGWEAKYDWQGFVSFEDLPQVFNPESGIIYSANQKIVAEDYPYHLTFDWTLPYRARRIEQMLTATDQHSVDSIKDMLGDVKSLMAVDLLPLLLKMEPGGPKESAALDLLKSWNHEMVADRPEPLIFYGWLRELTRLIYADELGHLFEKNWKIRPLFLQNVLSNQDGPESWCNNTNTSQRETCQELVSRALTLALEDLSQRYGETITDWRWGDTHFAHSAHRPFTIVAGLNEVFDIKVPSPGGAYTVNVGRNTFSKGDTPFASQHAASFRAIYDLADLEQSQFVFTTGQSGNPFSRNYSSMVISWSENRYFPLSQGR